MVLTNREDGLTLSPFFRRLKRKRKGTNQCGRRGQNEWLNDIT
ncbi:MAG: hypothetical protein ACTS4X_00445 [Candidatus Hodgkinia cicadicola]